MTRAILVLILVCVFAMPSGAAEDGVAPAKPIAKQTPAQKRSAELDRGFGKLRSQAGQTQRILDLWMQSDSATADVLLQQAMRAMSDGDLDTALEVLDRMLVSYPNYAEVYNKRAMVYFAKGDYDKSLVDIERVLDLEPRHFGAIAGKGVILLEQGKNLDALKAFQEAVAINPHMEMINAAIKAIQHDVPDI
jgi:tetratricopeptide (TPR) repeat protein